MKVNGVSDLAHVIPVTGSNNLTYVFSTSEWKDDNISVTFNYTEYVITQSSGTHGKIEPNSSVSVLKGSNASFSIIPEPYYSIRDLLVDGRSQLANVSFGGGGQNGTYTFTNVTSNHTLSTTFNLPPICINDIPNKHRTANPQGSEIITEWGSLPNQSFYWSGEGRVYITGSSTNNACVRADDDLIVTNESGKKLTFRGYRGSVGGCEMYAGIADITSLCKQGNNHLVIQIQDICRANIGWWSPAWIYFNQDGSQMNMISSPVSTMNNTLSVPGTGTCCVNNSTPNLTSLR